jgi:hypothetical protein
MPEITVEGLFQDQNFWVLPPSEKQKVFARVDANFAALAPVEQEKATHGLIKKYSGHVAPLPEQPSGATPELQQVIDDLNPFERVLVGIGKGFNDVGQGVKQMALQAGEAVGVVPEGRHAEYTRQVAEEEEAIDKPLLRQSPAATTGRFVGQMAATAPAAYLVGGKPATIPGKMAQGGAIGGMSAGVMPTKEGESRLKNFALGATVGASTAGALASTGKGYRALRGDGSAERATELGALSQEHNVPLFVGELRGSPTFQRVEQMLERVPLVGTAGKRARQAESLHRAAKSLVDRYGVTDDVGEALQDSLSRTLAGNKQAATELFDQLSEAAAKTGNKVSLGNVRAVVSRIMDNEGQLPAAIQDEKIIAALQKYGSLEDLPFEVARKVRSRLGKEMRKASKQAVSGSASDEEVAALKMLYGAVEDDIAAFAAKEGGEIGGLYQQANSFYRAKVVPFKDRALRKVGTDEFDTDQIIGMFIKNDRPKLAQKLMGNLDPDGRAVVKYAVLKDAFESATGGANKTAFSPAKFAGRLERLGKSKQSIFPGEELRNIEGFVKLSRAAERAGQFAENPPTGMRWLDASIMGGATIGAAVNPGAVASAGGMSLVLSRMLTTKFGRSVLTRAAGLPEKSRVWERILYKDVPRAMALAGEQITEPEQKQDRRPRN